MTKIFDCNGRLVSIGKELGKGGEGIVSEINGDYSVVAKVYLKLPSPEKSKKITKMIEIGNKRLYKLAAWPLASLHNFKGNVIGFVMPKLTDQKPIYELYSPKLRLQNFSLADWRFLIHAATNTARAFSVIHDSGNVVGDVNHGNLVVSQDATVYFIDTDSFQIKTSKEIWLCEVGVPTHQPPELQGVSSYRGILRTPHHDNFGLAVLIFQLLCLGRHPFSGQFSGKGEMPLEQAIAEFRFAYSVDTSRTQMKPPIASLPLNALTPNIRALFEKAFSKEALTKGRPTAKEWIFALEELSSKLKRCSNNLSHHYVSDNTQCPWCNIEGMSGSMLFPYIISQNVQKNTNINFIWQQIINMKSLHDDSPVLVKTPTSLLPSINAKEAIKKLNSWKVKYLPFYATLSIFFFIFLLIPSFVKIVMPNIGTVQMPEAVSYIGYIRFFSFLASIAPIAVAYLFYIRFKRKICAPFRKLLDDAEQLRKSLCSLPSSIGSNDVFSNIRQGLNIWKNQYDQLEKEKKQRLQTLQSQYQNNLIIQRQQDLKKHLQQYQIIDARIPGFKHGRITTLRNYGIITAADIQQTRLFSIKGFGKVLVQELLDWRNHCEKNFHFTPSNIPQSQILAIEREFSLKRQKIEQQLLTGFQTLSKMKQETQAHYQKLRPQIKQAFETYDQAYSDIRHLKISI